MGTNEIVEKLEVMRKKRNKYGCSVGIILLLIIPIFGVVSFFVGSIVTILLFIAMLVAIVLICVASGKITKEYKRLYKESFVYSILEEQFDNVTYKYNEGLPENYVRQFGLVRMGNRYSAEDYIKGSYKGISFEQSEVTIKHDKKGDDGTEIRFRGRMIAFDFPIKEVKSVQVFTEHFPYRDTPQIDCTMKHVDMESTDFNKRFDVLAADPVEAFYVLTPQMMERVDFLKEKFSHVGMNFQGNKLYVGIWSGTDAFDGDPSRPVNYLDEKTLIISDVRVITDIIDVLGLMRDKEVNV